MRQEAIEALLRSLERLQISGEYSDLKIFCGDQVFSAHKALICPRSEFFAKACKWGNDGQPKGEVDLGKDDPNIVKLMIDYLYRLDYDDVLPRDTPPTTEEPLSEEPDPPISRTAWDHMLTPKERKRRQKRMQLDGAWESRLTQEMIDNGEVDAAVEVFPLEDATAISTAEAETQLVYEPEVVTDVSYGWGFAPKQAPIKKILRLQDLVRNTNTERIVVNAHLYALADKYGIEDLKLLAKAKFAAAAAQSWKSEAFVKAAELAFENTPSSDLGLRSVVISTLHQHRELKDYEEVQNLLNSGNGIAWQVLKVLL